jgi:hypothetical protein
VKNGLNSNQAEIRTVEDKPETPNREAIVAKKTMYMIVRERLIKHRELCRRDR